MIFFLLLIIPFGLLKGETTSRCTLISFLGHAALHNIYSTLHSVKLKEENTGQRLVTLYGFFLWVVLSYLLIYRPPPLKILRILNPEWMLKEKKRIKDIRWVTILGRDLMHEHCIRPHLKHPGTQVLSLARKKIYPTGYEAIE